MTRRYYVETFGCRVNQADSAGLVADLDLGDHVRTQDPADAEVLVLNTCTVTHRSDADVRRAVHRMKRDNPGARVIVTGCYAQRDPNGAKAIEGVDAVIGNAHKKSLPVIAESILSSPPITPQVLHSNMHLVDPLDLPPVEPVTTVLDHTRPFVKIQDGCDAACTYCIIPAVRGPARSATPERILSALEELIRAGHEEIVLAGVHLGTYGLGLPPGDRETLAGLVERCLALPGLGRLRLSCIEPMAFPIALADLCARDPRLMPHFHLPLQSGSDAVLKRMARPYRAAEYRAMLEAIRARLPGVCLGADVIVGFPGETDTELEQTCHFVEKSGLDYIHVFSYSDRDGTPSTRLKAKVDPRIIKARSIQLHEVGDRIWSRFLDAQLGRTLEVLTLLPNPGRPGWSDAIAPNYAPVRIEAALPSNRVLTVEIIAKREGNLIARQVATRPAASRRATSASTAAR